MVEIFKLLGHIHANWENELLGHIHANWENDVEDAKVQLYRVWICNSRYRWSGYQISTV